MICAFLQGYYISITAHYKYYYIILRSDFFYCELSLLSNFFNRVKFIVQDKGVPQRLVN